MISNRNINPGAESYVMISAYQGASRRDINKARHKSIEDAVDATVRQVPGGEFLTNVKIYFVNSQYFMVEGDVWGKDANKGTVIETMKGFHVGDRVQFKQQMGTIISIIDAKECLVQLDGNTYGTKMEYEKIIKIDINSQSNNSNNNNNSNSNNSNNNNEQSNDINQYGGYSVGEEVRYLSKKFIPAEWKTGKIIRFSFDKFNSDKKNAEIEYFDNKGNPKIEIVSILNLKKL